MREVEETGDDDNFVAGENAALHEPFGDLANTKIKSASAAIRRLGLEKMDWAADMGK